MPLFRLLATDGNVVGVFPAPDDHAALTRGRQIAKDFVRPGEWFHPRPNVRIERQANGGLWDLVAAWQPWSESSPSTEVAEDCRAVETPF